MPFGKLSGALGFGKTVKDLFSNTRSRRRSDLRYGHFMDQQFSLGTEAAMWSRAQERGLTPQEYYGSSAAGAPSVSGGAQVLGNNETVMAKQRLETAAMLGNAEQERRNRKEVAEIQADAQVQSAEIGSEATQEAAKTGAVANVAIARLRNLIEARKVDLSEREFNEVTLPAAAANLKMKEQEVKKAVHEVATSAPSFVRGNILLTMGFDNTMQNMVLKRFAIDPTSVKSMQALSKKQFEHIMTVMLGYSSSVGRETRGIGKTASDLVSWIREQLHDLSPPGKSDILH